jgi:hypothetical protein
MVRAETSRLRPASFPYKSKTLTGSNTSCDLLAILVR